MTEVTYVKPAKDDYIKKIKNGVKSVTTKFKSTRKESPPSPIEKSLENLQSLLKKENMAQQTQSDVCSGSSPSLEQHNGQIYQKPDEADKSSAESLSVEDRIKEMSISISARPMSPHFQRLNEVDERQSSPELVENRTAEFSTVSSSTQTSYQEQALKDKYLRLYDNASKEAVEIKLRCQTLEQLQNNYVAKRDHVIKKSKYNTNGGYKFDGEQPLSEPWLDRYMECLIDYLDALSDNTSSRSLDELSRQFFNDPFLVCIHRYFNRHKGYLSSLLLTFVPYKAKKSQA